MDDLPALAVTGSTGRLGSLIARQLADDGLALRLPVRDLGRAPDLPGAVAVPVSYADAEASEKALRGLRTLFMVSAAEAPDRVQQHRRFVDAAVAAGVEHLVYTSFVGASPTCTFTLGRDHYATEQHIEASGLRWTFLRDNFYLALLTEIVGEDGVIRGPAGDGRLAAVAHADVARAAAAVLRDPAPHQGCRYDLTGPEAISLGEAAEQQSTRERPVRYHAETVEEAYESRRRWPAAGWQYDAWVSTYTAIAQGELARVSDDVERLTGRRPLSFGEYLAEAR